MKLKKMKISVVETIPDKEVEILIFAVDEKQTCIRIYGSNKVRKMVNRCLFKNKENDSKNIFFEKLNLPSGRRRIMLSKIIAAAKEVWY